MPSEFRQIISLPLLRKNLTVALVVGTVLNLINQTDSFLTTGALDWLKLALNYCVPFLVASYGSYNSLRSMVRPGGAGKGIAAT